MEKIIQPIQTKKDVQREAQKSIGNKMKASQSSGDYKKSLKLQTSMPRSGRQSHTTSPTTSIPSSYLRMLDIRIAELEGVTGLSFPSTLSPVQSSPMSLLSLKSRILKPSIVQPYPEKYSVKSSGSSADETGALAMERYLDDNTEADGVHAAILASNNITSR